VRDGLAAERDRKTSTGRTGRGLLIFPDYLERKASRGRIGGSMRLKAFAVVSLLFVAVSSNAATWYVSPSGNDANAGSLSAPFRTITKGVSRLVPGDHLLVRGGTYNEAVSIWNKYGTAAAPITVSAYPNEVAIIDGAGTTANGVVTIGGDSSHITFERFEVRNGPKAGILLYNANNIRVRGNNVHHNFTNGIYVTSSSSLPVGTTHHVVVEGNDIHDNVLQNQYLTATSWMQALSTWRAAYVDFIGNSVHHNYGEGIDFIVSDYGTIVSNVVYDNFSVNVYLDNARRCLPKGSLVPVPLVCTVRFGAPVALLPDEEKDAFLERARAAVVALA
jgi:parallel beta-helix repeat protein